MTKPISRKMAVDCLLWRLFIGEWIRLDILTSTGARFVCPICKNDLIEGQDIQFDHIHADVFGGKHDSRNLRPVHADCHKLKTARDIADNAKIRRILADAPSKRPMRKSGRRIPSRPFPKCASAKPRS